VVGGVLFGVGFAVGMIVLGLALGRERERTLFAVVLGVAAGVYAGSALAVPEGHGGLQAGGVVLFVIWAMWGRDRTGVLAGAWFGHALWDLFHLTGPAVSGLPGWYELACLVADPILAAYLVMRLRIPAAAS
jgi:uncharacterized membrane protein YhdT